MKLPPLLRPSNKSFSSSLFRFLTFIHLPPASAGGLFRAEQTGAGPAPGPALVSYAGVEGVSAKRAAAGRPRSDPPIIDCYGGSKKVIALPESARLWRIATGRSLHQISGMVSYRAAWRAAILCTLLAASPARAQEPVDVELILAVDVSLSMSPGELEIQRRGYAEALTHDTVIRAIQNGVHGRIALAYFEWAGALSQRVVVPWTLIGSAEDAKAVAERLTVNPSNSARRTSISAAMDFALDLFRESTFAGLRRVVDISGDGPNNEGRPVLLARERLLNAGVTINGLPLMTSSGYRSSYDVEDLDLYYKECVVGGPGSFTIPVNDWTQFPEAVRRKLVIELAGQPPERERRRAEIVKVQAKASYDCLIGEKIWENRMLRWQP